MGLSSINKGLSWNDQKQIRRTAESDGTYTESVSAEVWAWDTNALAYVRVPADTATGALKVYTVNPGGGGGGAMTVADGADVAQGATTDLSTANTVIGLLKAVKAAVTGTLTTARSWTLSSGTDSVNVGNFPATQPVSIATNTPDVTDRAARLLGHVTVDNASIPVTGTFWQSTQPVSLATNTPDVTDRAARLLGHVTVDSAPTTAVTAASLPLPSGAATDASLTNGNQRGSFKLLDSGGTNVLTVNANGAAMIQGYQPAVSAFNSVTATGALTSTAATGYNIATVTLRTFTGTTPSVTFKVQASDDNTNWVDLQGIHNTTGQIGTTWTQAAALSAGTAGPSVDYAIGAYTNVRINVTAISGASATAAFGLALQTLPYEPSPGVTVTKRDATTGLSPKYSATHVTAAGTTTVTAATGYISSILVVCTSGTTPTCKIQNKEATPKLFTPPSSMTANTVAFNLQFNEPLIATSGIDIVATGTSPVFDVFITYWQ